MNRAHIWSDVPDDWRASSSGDANEHADEEGGIVRNVNTISELLKLFNGWLDAEESFDILDFHTHGGPGVIYIGSEELNVGNLRRLSTSRINEIFNNDAQIVFNGCNVGEGHQGEWFLLRFGKLMLKGGGGKVIGNTGLGIADAFFSGDVFHPFGDWVGVRVGMGGSAKLYKHKHLIEDKIKERIESAEERIERLPDEDFSVSADKAKLAAAVKLAKKYLADPKDENLFYACDEIAAVEKKLYRIERERIFRHIPKNAIK